MTRAIAGSSGTPQPPFRTEQRAAGLVGAVVHVTMPENGIRDCASCARVQLDAELRCQDRAVGDFYCDEALSGQTSVEVVTETADVLAFHHTRPSYPVHIVVVPKRHIPSLTDLGDATVEDVAAVVEVVRRVAGEVEAEWGAARVVTNLGTYQDSKHLHFHVVSGVPRD